MKRITQSEIASRVMSGEMFTTGEWRSSVAKASTRMNEDTKQMETRKAIVHQIEFVDFKTKTEMPFEVTEECPLDFNVEAYNAKPREHAKGDKVAIEVKSFGWSDFKKRYLGKGTIHGIDNPKATK